MTPGAFETALNTLFVDRHYVLAATEICSKAGHDELVIVGEQPASAVSELEWALRDEMVCRHLKTWAGSLLLKLRITVGWTVPFARIDDGVVQLLFRDPIPSKPSFEEWFENLIGSPPPFRLALEQRSDWLWGDPWANKFEAIWSDTEVRLKGSRTYDLVGFGGKGSLSFAVYFTRVRKKTCLTLRLPWDGRHMTSGMEPRCLLSSIQEGNALFEQAATRGLPMWLNSNMGEWSVLDAFDPRIDWRSPQRSFAVARRYVETENFQTAIAEHS